MLSMDGGEVRPHTSVTNRLVRSERAAIVTALISLTFGTVLIIWGTSVGAATMTGGGILSVGRGVMAGFLVLGIRLSRRHTANFPDGLYKVENIFAAIVGVIIMVLAYELARASIPHLDGTYLFSTDPRSALPFFLVAALLGVALGLYKRHVGRAERCPSLEADAYFSFADAGALVIIGVALALDIAGVPRVDAIAGLIVACFLAVIGGWILRGALRVLLDASVSRDLLAQVRQIAEADPGIRRVLTVDARNSGSFVFVHLVVEPRSPDLSVAYGVARELQERLRTELPNVDSVGIEFGGAPGGLSVAVLLAEDGETVASSFAGAPRVAFFELDPGKPSNGTQDASPPEAAPQIVSNPAQDRRLGAGVYLAVFLGRRSIDMLLVREELRDEDARQALLAYDIDVRVAPDAVNLVEARRELASVAAQRLVSQ